MLIRIEFDPAGEEAEIVRRQWADQQALALTGSGQVEIPAGICLAALGDLRDRCYDRGLAFNVEFAGSERSG